MKRTIRLICILLVICMVASITIFAETVVEPRASAFFAAHDTFLYKTASNQFQVWFDVTANATDIDMLGVSKIEVYRSSDQSNWIKMRTYNYEDYPEMMDYNSGSHTGYVTYNYATPGYYYRAHITFYAKNSTGTGNIFRFTAIMQM